MDTELKKIALMCSLKSQSNLYYGKIEELYNEIERWLSYIPQSFPHYTRHTIPHSIEIVRQISFLLFKENDPGLPVINLSPTEAYILIAVAFLHDAGMVASDKEKAEILLSDEWRNWTSGKGVGAKRWLEIKEFRECGQPENVDLRNFLADLQVRFMLAEFIRRRHHKRASRLISLNQRDLGRFAFDDPILLETIDGVCTAHGLSKHELFDRERFPERRNIRGDQVNLQFMATLIRLGDLLDMTHDRACPLLLNAASPIPADSLAHWTQYQKITHRLTAPDKIEITAKCQNQNEHRYLRDWCQWLEEEVANATILKAQWERHKDWKVPIATEKGESPTIKIQPGPNATYIPWDWKMELDHEAIFERLIFDVYDEPDAYIRELLQNALDATRCKMYADYQSQNIEAPAYPTQFPEEVRCRYPVKVMLKEEENISELSGVKETRQVLIIEDNGIGMDSNIIQKYFLQVGRSFYVTDEFRRQFRFNPTSRFGVGFLSVFGVSDFIEVETYKPESVDGPLRITLTGPRNYLLIEKIDRQIVGTRIEVTLRQPYKQEELTKKLEEWCKRVEFPIEVDDLGKKRTLVAENSKEFLFEMPLVTDTNALFLLRSFPINRLGIEGEVYVLALINEKGESWTASRWAEYEYPKLHPYASSPILPDSIYCVNGINYVRYSRYGHFSPGFVERIDYRRSLENFKLTKIEHRFWMEELKKDIDPVWREILEDHLRETPFAQGDDGWIYKQRLIKSFSGFKTMSTFWKDFPGTIGVFKKGKRILMSLKEIEEERIITLAIEPEWRSSHRYVDDENPEWDNESISLWGKDLEYLQDVIKRIIFAQRWVNNLRWLNSGYLALDFIKDDKYDEKDFFKEKQVVNFPDDNAIYFECKIVKHDDGFFNKKHNFVTYLFKLRKACEENKYNLTEIHFEKLISLAMLRPWVRSEEFDKLHNYLNEMRSMPDLPKELKPPQIKFSWQMFEMKPPGSQEMIPIKKKVKKSKSKRRR
ncbi:MAG: ATP-binding protein [Syntrophobacterales bacterium]